MRIDGKDFTVADYIEEEKATCQSGTELTFKLIALAHYLPSDATWTSRNGEEWSIPKLIRAEIEAPIHGAACGGSHRLFAIANAVKERQKRGEPIDGQWARAAKYTADYQRYTLANLQNPDGSFSTEWFNTPGRSPRRHRPQVANHRPHVGVAGLVAARRPTARSARSRRRSISCPASCSTIPTTRGASARWVTACML